ncbi:hypothetical protein [Burkholderia sp. Bp9140]|uniref:hypothetical protein n=1 Tax=Burkholderia sp. Bp9140 TaxID=2184572 RepID=UPI001C8A21F9|nr:hypothetical protein [Burkholderia sp. Bp9140]
MSASSGAFGTSCPPWSSSATALIDTDMLKGNPAIKPTLIPVGRFGRTDEVASVVVMLARNGDITGQTININGGGYVI